MKYALLIAIVGLLAGCRSEATKKSDDIVTSHAPSETTASERAVPFAGAKGTVAGTIRISGDAPPLLPELAEIPVGKCFKAHETHKQLFRKAADGALADVLVAVTEYEGKLPTPQQPIQLTIEDCAFSQRTIGMMIGQEIEVQNRGPSAATPQLIGSPVPAIRVAVPGGKPITLLPHAPGKYRMVDRSHEFAFAEVFVLNYPTVTVTDIKGRFEIKDVPIGDVRVSALLPLTELKADKEVTVRADETTEVNFEFVFSLNDWKSALQEEAKAQAEAPQPEAAPNATRTMGSSDANRSTATSSPTAVAPSPGVVQ